MLTFLSLNVPIFLRPFGKQGVPGRISRVPTPAVLLKTSNSFADEVDGPIPANRRLTERRCQGSFGRTDTVSFDEVQLTNNASLRSAHCSTSFHYKVVRNGNSLSYLFTPTSTPISFLSLIFSILSPLHFLSVITQSFGVISEVIAFSLGYLSSSTPLFSTSQRKRKAS